MRTKYDVGQTVLIPVTIEAIHIPDETTISYDVTSNSLGKNFMLDESSIFGPQDEITFKLSLYQERGEE